MSVLFYGSKCFKQFNLYYCCARKLNSKIPVDPIPPIKENTLPPRTRIDQNTIELLERLSLVKFGNKEGIETLEEAIRFADRIFTVKTEGVEPMITVLEDSSLYLRDDVVTEGNCRADILSNAAVTEEDYFVTPPGNVPLIASKKY